MCHKTKPNQTQISECCKLAQKEYNSRHDWEVKVINWELCKKLKFDLTTKCEWHILWEFEIQTDHLIPTRRPDLVIISKTKKKNQLNSELCRPGGPQSENQGKRNKYLDFVRELRKLGNMKMTVIPMVIGVHGMVPKGLVR